MSFEQPPAPGRQALNHDENLTGLQLGDRELEMLKRQQEDYDSRKNKEVLYDTTRTALPMALLILCIIAGTVLLVYTVALHQPVPARFSIGAAIAFGIIAFFILAGSSLLYYWRYDRVKRRAWKSRSWSAMSQDTDHPDGIWHTIWSHFKARLVNQLEGSKESSYRASDKDDHPRLGQAVEFATVHDLSAIEGRVMEGFATVSDKPLHSAGKETKSKSKGNNTPPNQTPNSFVTHRKDAQDSKPQRQHRCQRRDDIRASFEVGDISTTQPQCSTAEQTTRNCLGRTHSNPVIIPIEPRHGKGKRSDRRSAYSVLSIDDILTHKHPPPPARRSSRQAQAQNNQMYIAKVPAPRPVTPVQAIASLTSSDFIQSMRQQKSDYPQLSLPQKTKQTLRRSSKGREEMSRTDQHEECCCQTKAVNQHRPTTYTCLYQPCAFSSESDMYCESHMKLAHGYLSRERDHEEDNTISLQATQASREAKYGWPRWTASSYPAQTTFPQGFPHLKRLSNRIDDSMPIPSIPPKALQAKRPNRIRPLSHATPLSPCIVCTSATTHESTINTTSTTTSGPSHKRCFSERDLLKAPSPDVKSDRRSGHGTRREREQRAMSLDMEMPLPCVKPLKLKSGRDQDAGWC